MNQTVKSLLKLLLKGPQFQRDLPQLLKVRRPTIKYHIDLLEQKGLIKKNLIAEAGSIKVVQLELNQLALPQIRNLLNLSVIKTTLISGFTFDPRIQDKETLKLPDIARHLLEVENLQIDKLVCFTTEKAMEERLKSNLPFIDRYIPYPFKVYQNPSFYQAAERELTQEIIDADVIIDITPLTKIYSITMLNIAHLYKLPVIYIARENSTTKLIKF